MAPLIKPILATESGFISQIDTRAVGLAVVELGGGRKKVSDGIDHSVGLTNVLGLGEKVEAGLALAYVHAQNENQANMAIQSVQNSYTTTEGKLETRDVILEYLN
jgi:thymidine phosphorylase